jgi:hypothetical protein
MSEEQRKCECTDRSFKETVIAGVDDLSEQIARVV